MVRNSEMERIALVKEMFTLGHFITIKAMDLEK